MIIGYQVKNSQGDIWAARSKLLVLSDKTAISDLNEALTQQPGSDHQITAVIEGSIPNATREGSQRNQEQYSCLAISSGDLSDNDMAHLDELAKDPQYNMILSRQTGWFITIYEELNYNLSYPGLSPEFFELLKETHEDGYRLLEIDSGIECDE